MNKVYKFAEILVNKKIEINHKNSKSESAL